MVPAYNESARLPRCLPDLVTVLRMQTWTFEVVIVDDGSTDLTAAIAAEILEPLPAVRVVRLPWNCGKGTAVRVGVNVARGAKVVFLDADLASDVSALARLVASLDFADIALASRTVEGATVEGRTWVRGLAAATYRRLVAGLTASPVKDTQCGFKAFRTPAAKLLFSMTTATGFGFDVEVLALASALGLRITECPVQWTAIEGSHVSLRRHGPGMLRDLHRARRHQQRARSAASLLRQHISGISGISGIVTPQHPGARPGHSDMARVIYLDAPAAPLTVDQSRSAASRPTLPV